MSPKNARNSDSICAAFCCVVLANPNASEASPSPVSPASVPSRTKSHTVRAVARIGSSSRVVTRSLGAAREMWKQRHTCGRLGADGQQRSSVHMVTLWASAQIPSVRSSSTLRFARRCSDWRQPRSFCSPGSTFKVVELERRVLLQADGLPRPHPDSLLESAFVKFPVQEVVSGCGSPRSARAIERPSMPEGVFTRRISPSVGSMSQCAHGWLLTCPAGIVPGQLRDHRRHVSRPRTDRA